MFFATQVLTACFSRVVRDPSANSVLTGCAALFALPVATLLVNPAAARRNTIALTAFVAASSHNRCVRLPGGVVVHEVARRAAFWGFPRETAARAEVCGRQRTSVVCGWKHGG